MIISDVLLANVLSLLLFGGLMISSEISLNFHDKVLSLLTDVVKDPKGVEIFITLLTHHQQSNFHHSEYFIDLLIPLLSSFFDIYPAFFVRSSIRFLLEVKRSFSYFSKCTSLVLFEVTFLLMLPRFVSKSLISDILLSVLENLVL